MDWKQKYYGELFHHGTKGMKWGDRKYQYKDGRLTPAGKLRYAKGESDDRKEKSRKASVTETNLRRKKEDAGEAYNKAKATGNKEEIAKAKAALDEATSKYTAAKRKLENAQTKEKNAKDAEARARQEQRDYRDDINNTRNAVNSIDSGTRSTTQGLSSLVDIANRAKNQRDRQKSDARTLTDADLQKAINRMNMENTYNSLKYDKRTSRGAEIVKTTLESVGSVVGVAGGVASVLLAIKQLRS